MAAMTIQAVVFDIGGVLEITPRLGVSEKWESRLGLAAGELDERMADAWLGGSIGTITERELPMPSPTASASVSGSSGSSLPICGASTSGPPTRN